MWQVYVMVLLSAILIYGMTAMRRRLARASPHQRYLDYIAIVGEFAAIVAALTAVFLTLMVDRQTCQYGRVGPLRMKLNNDQELADIKHMQNLLCADSTTAKQSLAALNERPNSAAAQYGRRVYAKLHQVAEK